MITAETAQKKLARLAQDQDPCLPDMARDIGDWARHALEAINRNDADAARHCAMVVMRMCGIEP